MNLKILGILVFVIILASILVLFYFYKKKKKIQKWAFKQLWIGEDKSCDDSYTLSMNDTSGNSPTIAFDGGVSYSFDMRVLKWLYDTKVSYREIFTHGNGSFNNMITGDIVSLSIDANKNNIHIQVKTFFDRNKEERKRKDYCAPKLNKSNVNDEDEDEEDYMDKASGSPKLGEEPYVEDVVLKYFPLVEYFHVVLVLSKKRIDLYMNGKLYGSKIFKGRIPTVNYEVFPIKFFFGHPIRGEISNFMFFNHELSVKKVKELYSNSSSGGKPKKDNDADDNKDLVNSSECNEAGSSTIGFEKWIKDNEEEKAEKEHEIEHIYEEQEEMEEQSEAEAVLNNTYFQKGLEIFKKSEEKQIEEDKLGAENRLEDTYEN